MKICKYLFNSALSQGDKISLLRSHGKAAPKAITEISVLAPSSTKLSYMAGAAMQFLQAAAIPVLASPPQPAGGHVMGAPDDLGEDRSREDVFNLCI